ncbi:MAG: hypothetical protein RIS94_910 [Pseudomonadota bacterium]
MNAVDEAGVTLSILLTRRLLDRFLPLLTQHVEAQVNRVVPVGLSLSMAQLKLRQERQQNPCRPVSAPREGETWLCVKMRLIPHNEGGIWALMGTEGQEVRMLLNDTHARAVLDVFHGKYLAMEWGCEKFPEWVADTANQAVSPQAVMH